MVARERRRASLSAALGPLLGALAAVACGGEGARAAAPGDSPEAAAQAEGEVPGGALAPSSVADPRAGAWNPQLRSRVDRWLDEVRRHTDGRVRPGDVEVSLRVASLASEVELAALAPDTALLPASNMKLVTTAAALVLLGPGLDFMTPIEALGEIRGSVLSGDLVVRAAGDPVCAPDGDARVEARLDALARAVVARGVRRVTGDLVLDEGTFQDPAPGPGWPDERQRWQEYCALAGGFSMNGGVLQARVQPASAPGPAAVTVHPAPYGLRSNVGVRSTRGGKLDVRVGATVTTVTVTGSLPAGRPEFVAEFSHPDPVAHFGHVLLDRLERAGVRVEGRLRRARDLPAGERLGEMRSAVDATLGPINADSRNGVADQLFLALGHAILGDGTRAAGAEATRRALEQLGVPADGLVQVDGSGLSRDNRVSAHQLSALLAAVLSGDARAADAFRASLAVAGRTGTLERRMLDGPAKGRVFAKTGWIRGVSAISGVLVTLSGEELVFSILVRYPPGEGGLNTSCFKPMQDEILTALVEEAP